MESSPWASSPGVFLSTGLDRNGYRGVAAFQSRNNATFSIMTLFSRGEYVTLRNDRYVNDGPFQAPGLEALPVVIYVYNSHLDKPLPEFQI
jgi:hypothetical protein